ncbi:hypothetical protein SXCC_03497 [Gluconacetobacter sp. SXCC-1]|nr:hypothetical protein SXCC_03497 [Gluconacetobacter sp. SXCC-1]
MQISQRAAFETLDICAISIQFFLCVKQRPFVYISKKTYNILQGQERNNDEQWNYRNFCT